MTAICCNSEHGRRDPTRTTTLRNRYMRDVVGRFRFIRREAIARLKDRLTVNFEFTRSDLKVSEFMTWLESATNEHILEIQPGRTIASAANGAWANKYIDSAYIAGLRQGASKLRASGAKVSERWVDAGFRRPIHADRLGVIYTRNYSELAGITAEMDRQIGRILAQGIGEGAAPGTIARQVAGRVDAIGITRARMLARTEVINAHAEATLNTYEEAGLEGVEVEAEFLTAVDACPQCLALAEQGPYSLQQARGLIPVHPNCRCAWAPIAKGGSGIELF